VAPLILAGCSLSWAYRRGGSAWTRASWILGLKRVGVEVFVVDQLDLARCSFKWGREHTYANALNVEWFDAVVERFGLEGRVALIGENGEALRGPGLQELQDLAASADALVNLSGDLRVAAIKNRVRRRVLVDLDPGLTQFWLAAGRPAPRIVEHDLHFTIGENVGRPECSIPAAGLQWRRTRQPVLLDEWPVTEAQDPWRFTTVTKWRPLGPHGQLSEVGLPFTNKADEFLRFAEVASASGEVFEIALSSVADDSETEPLRRAGWVIADAAEVAESPDSFRDYVQRSGAEFSAAKGAYAHTNSGWFSDRTTRYLASGKPALVQDTGFASNIPVGEGLFSFRTVEDAVAGARAIASDYARHAAAARKLAEEYFAAEVVLSRFIDEVLDAEVGGDPWRRALTPPRS
jgi:hypothetical protein